MLKKYTLFRAVFTGGATLSVMATPRSGNVFARSVLCDEAISKFMSFARLSGDCLGTPALVRLKPHGARENRLAKTYRGFVKRPWNHHALSL